MILDRIVKHKQTEVAEQKQHVSEQTLQRQIGEAPTARPFIQSLLQSPYPVSLIAEIKRASPSKGVIRADFDHCHIAETYATNGAAALSVLTDEHFFKGHLQYLTDIRQRVHLPLLRKDFIIDPYQIIESRAAGADAILLIVACLDHVQLVEYQHMANELGMDALVEVHNEDELEQAMAMKAKLIGINNRDLRTFHTTLTVTERLAQSIPSDIPFVSESGIFTHDDMQRVQRAGARAVLVGESLMRRDDMAAHMAHLLGEKAREHST